MSALSVMSLIAPTAPVGAAASVETAADEDLFAGLVAAAATSPDTQGEDSAPILEAMVKEADAADTPPLDVTAAIVPAWPPLPLIAPSPLPVAPPAEISASEEAVPAGSSLAPTPPPPPAPPLDAEAPTAAASAANEAPAAAPAPLADATALAKPAGVAAAAPLPGAASADARPAQPLSDAPRPTATATATAETPLAPPGQAPRQSEQAIRGTVIAPTPTPPAAIAPITADSPAEPHPENALAPRAAGQIRETVTMTATSVPAATVATATPVAAAPLAADGPTTPTAAQAPQGAKSVESIVLSAAAPVATAGPRQDAAAAPAKPALTAAPAIQQPAPSVEATDTAEAVVASATASTEAEGETPPQLSSSQASSPPTAAPVRNGAARLDERRSNAATANAPTEAKVDIGGARAILSPSSPSVAAPSAPATAVVDAVAATAPVLPTDAAPLDVQPDAAPTHQQLDAQITMPGAQRDLGLSQLSRATVETTAQLAAQIIKKLEGRSTRFDMALSPEGLGRVDVSLEIDSDGRLAARLAFDNPAAATDLRARADELRRQLQDAGFQLTQDSLEFSERNPSSGFGGDGAFDRAPDRRAFAGAARLAAQADTALPPPGPWASLSLTPDRVDMKV